MWVPSMDSVDDPLPLDVYTTYMHVSGADHRDQHARASAEIPLGCLIGDQPVLHDAEANQRGLSRREGSKKSPGLDHSGVEMGRMYVVPLCSRWFAMVIVR
jgi:hypothetical protein